MGTDEACVEGCDSKKSAKSQLWACLVIWVALTKHVAGTCIKPKDLLVLQCVAQSHEQTSTSFQSVNDVGFSGLKASR
jgi:hypothetical protein